jgi:FixJ family two-component response regulator
VNPASTKRQLVAVVDDEPSVLTGLKRMLTASGFAAEVFDSAEEFLARGAADELVCLVVDINLGGMSGIELRRRLTAQGSRVPVIFITARDDDATRREALGAGCAAYLGKPISGRVLVDAIARAVGLPKMRA